MKNVRWFEDHATERTTSREQLQAVIDDAKNGRCKMLILWKLDRLARSCRDTLNLLHDVMTAGCTVIIVAQGLTLDNCIMSKAVVQLMGLIAELESGFISERIRAGLAVARAKAPSSDAALMNGRDPSSLAGLGFAYP